MTGKQVSGNLGQHKCPVCGQTHPLEPHPEDSNRVAMYCDQPRGIRRMVYDAPRPATRRKEKEND